MNTLLQTTQSSGGMATWSAMDWTIFFSALSGFVVGAIIPLVLAFRRMKLVDAQMKTIAQAVSENVPTTPEITTEVDRIANS